MTSAAICLKFRLIDARNYVVPMIESLSCQCLAKMLSVNFALGVTGAPSRAAAGFVNDFDYAINLQSLRLSPRSLQTIHVARFGLGNLVVGW